MKRGQYIRTPEVINKLKSYIRTPDTIKRMSISHKGKKLTEEHKRKIGNSVKGQKRTIETKLRISQALKGRKRIFTKEWKNNISKSLKGRQFKNRFIGGKGEKAPNWKGGLTSENSRIRNSFEFDLWRTNIFIRDNWTCQKCKTRGGRLHPHHIFNFYKYKDLRFLENNGITFCIICHKEFHSIYGNRNNNQNQIAEFLQQIKEE